MTLFNPELTERIRRPELMNKIMSAETAADIVKKDHVVGISGFTSSGYPKAVPVALAKKAQAGEAISFDLYSGASVGPEVDTELSEAGIIQRRYPYQTNNSLRNRINDGFVEYCDMHLSVFPQFLNYNYMKPIDAAIVEALAITEEGHLIPTTSVGATPSIIRRAKKVVVEINLSVPLQFEGMADIYIPDNPPNREPIPITSARDRIGTPYIECGPDKIVAIVITNDPDKTRPLKGLDETSKQISAHILRFLDGEVAAGRLTDSLLPIQSGVGSVANAVLFGLCESQYSNLTCYTEVVQDSMLELIHCGKATAASTTAISPSPQALAQMIDEIDFYKDKIVLRPQEISNHPEVIRRLGLIAMNTALEADIYGNINSTHVLGSKMMNGIGGSGDFSRNAALTIFSTTSTAKDGKISSIVPMCSHVDHTEHEVSVLVTEQGYADLRGLSPKERALSIIQNCAHPDYRDALLDYFSRASASSSKHTPHILSEALSWHTRFEKTGTMKL